ncbi:BolA family protein [Nitrincola alkalilacustris]|uniref:BolA family protein n=1 Tax=Nitrincola alkalilacustris TaxID=1571224 RepID=UPI00124EA822|nr:BolA family protein [Nitrincola alkalilacustris]
MSTAQRIEQLLTQTMQVEVFNLENESHMHSGPATESHFKLTLVSPDFANLNKVRRHQLIYGQLSELMQNPIHALTMHLFTPEEWVTAQNSVPDSPNCRGGSKAG